MSFVFRHAKIEFLTHELNWEEDDIHLMLVRPGWKPTKYMMHLSVLEEQYRGPSVSMQNRCRKEDTAGAASTVFSPEDLLEFRRTGSNKNNRKIEGLLIYRKTDNLLVAYICASEGATSYGLPFFLDAKEDEKLFIDWDQGSNMIFSV